MGIFRCRGVCFSGLFAALLLLGALGAAAAEPRRILILSSFGPHFEPWNNITARFREQLIEQSPYPIDFYEAALQSDRLGNAFDERPFVGYLRTLFADRGLDLVIAIGAPAGRFFINQRREIFQPTPLIISGADEKTLQGSQRTRNDAFVTSTFDQVVPIESILKVLPDTRNIAMVIGASPIDAFWVEQDRRAVAPLQPRVTFEWLNELSIEDMQARVAHLPPHSAIFYSHVHVDARGVPQQGNRAFVRLRAAANAPMFSYIDSNFGQGLVGGPMISTQQLANATASVATRILRGETPGDIRTTVLGLSVPKYDWRELQRWNVSSANLPPDSEIYFRGLTTWEQHRSQLIALCGFLFVQTLLIGWLMFERRRRQNAEVSARDSLSELAQMNRLAAAGELSGSIAHEISQPLGGMMLNASAALNLLARATPDIRKAQDALQNVVAAGRRASDIITSIRAMFGRDTQQRAPTDVNRLIRTVLGLVYMDLRKHSIESQIVLSEQLPFVVGNEIQLQQVILNLLMNAIDAMKSEERRVLSVKSEIVEKNFVRVSIADTGSGVDLANLNRMFKPMFTTKARGMGMGLSICKSIIDGHNGRIWWSAGVPSGSIFIFELPMSRDSKAKAEEKTAAPGLLNDSPNVSSKALPADEMTE